MIEKRPVESWIHLRPFGFAPGDYMMRCPVCKEMKYDVDKRALCCEDCATELYNKDKTIYVQADH
jgi:hypothetical protein